MITSLVMVGAVLASLALGVLLAYALCGLMFMGFRMHARQVTQIEATVAVVRAGAIEG